MAGVSALDLLELYLRSDASGQGGDAVSWFDAIQRQRDAMEQIELYPKVFKDTPAALEYFKTHPEEISERTNYVTLIDSGLQVTSSSLDAQQLRAFAEQVRSTDLDTALSELAADASGLYSARTFGGLDNPETSYTLMPSTISTPLDSFDVDNNDVPEAPDAALAAGAVAGAAAASLGAAKVMGAGEPDATAAAKTALTAAKDHKTAVLIGAGVGGAIVIGAVVGAHIAGNVRKQQKRFDALSKSKPRFVMIYDPELESTATCGKGKGLQHPEPDKTTDDVRIGMDIAWFTGNHPTTTITLYWTDVRVHSSSDATISLDEGYNVTSDEYKFVATYKKGSVTRNLKIQE